MITDQTDIWTFGLYVAGVVAVVASMLGLPALLGERHWNKRERRTEIGTGVPYESGVWPTGTAQLRLPVQYYLACVCAMSSGDRDADRMDDYKALFWSRPWLAGALTLMLLSLAGIPLTAGFVGKFYAIMAGFEGGVWWLVLALVLNSALGIYYYLRWLLVLFDPPVPGRLEDVLVPAPRWGAWLSLAVLASLLLWLGVHPSPLISWIRSAMTPLLGPLAGSSF
jgi:hypothetical protein